MGNQVAGRLPRTVALLGRLLDQDERDAVLGDLVESRAPRWRALADLSGLIVRRHAARWHDWKPWLALVSIVVPIGAALSHAARWWADVNAIYAWMYVNHWTSAHVSSPGARAELVDHATAFVLCCLTLIGWSWTAGVALRSIASRAVSTAGPLFCVIVAVGTLGTTTAARIAPGNAAAFSTAFYDVIFPWTLRIALVIAPAVLGMRLDPTRHPAARIVVISIVVAALTLASARGLENALVFGRGLIPVDPGADRIVGTFDDGRLWRWLPLVMVWPAVFLAVMAGARDRLTARARHAARSC